MTLRAWLAHVLASYRHLDADARLRGWERICAAEVVAVDQTSDPPRPIDVGHQVRLPGHPDAEAVKRRWHTAYIVHQLHDQRPGDAAVTVPAKRARRRSPRRVVAFERSA